VDVLRLLIFSGRADLAAADDEGFTPFMLAAQVSTAPATLHHEPYSLTHKTLNLTPPPVNPKPHTSICKP
jgi:hypothetical protein